MDNASSAERRVPHRRQLRLLMAGIAAFASAFFLSSSSSSSSSLMGGGLLTKMTKKQDQQNHRRVTSALDSENPYGVLRDDGTLFIPVGYQRSSANAQREGQHLHDIVPGTRLSLCDDLLADLHLQQLGGLEEGSDANGDKSKGGEGGNADANEHDETSRERRFTRLHVEAGLCGDHSIGDIAIDYFRYNLLAHLAGLPFTFTCHNALPGVFNLLQQHECCDTSSLTPFIEFHDFDPGYTLEESCRSDNYIVDLSRAIPLIQNNIRRVASHPSLQNVEADDAVIHLRLNDILKGDFGVNEDEPSLRGLFPHSTYSYLLKKAEAEKGYNLASISIIAQVNDKDTVRGKDKAYVERSVQIANDFAEYLQIEFPSAVVTVRNDWRTESTTTAYARMVRAKKVVICGRSGFCLYPSLSVEDDVLVYLFYRPTIPGHSVLIKAASDKMDNVRLWDAPYLGNNQIEFMAEEQVNAFLHNGTTASVKVIS